MNPSEFEDKIVRALLAGDDPQLRQLRRQYREASVRERNFTGVGVFTHFELPAVVEPAQPQNFVIRDVSLDVANTENGASAMLFVRNGRIDFLEVVATTGDWPDEPALAGISYFRRKSCGDFDELVSSDTRDLAVTRRAWSKEGKSVSS